MPATAALPGRRVQPASGALAPPRAPGLGSGLSALSPAAGHAQRHVGGVRPLDASDCGPSGGGAGLRGRSRR